MSTFIFIATHHYDLISKEIRIHLNSLIRTETHCDQPADKGRIMVHPESNRLKDEKGRQSGRDTLSRGSVVAFVWENAEGWPIANISENVTPIFGYDSNDFLSGRISFSQVVHPEDLSRVSKEVEGIGIGNTAGRVVHAPFRIITRVGAVQWVEGFTRVLRDKDGGVTAYEGFFIDITRRRKMEERFALIQFSIDHAAEGISWISADGRIVYANNEECRRLGYTREELLNMTAFDVDQTLTLHSWQEEWAELRQQGTVFREAVHRTKSGEVFPIESVIHYINYHGKEFSLAFRRDIAERKRAEEERGRLQANLANAVEIADLGPWEHDIVNDVFILNDHFYKVYHTTVEQVGGYTMDSEEFVRRFTHPDDVAFVKEEMRKIMGSIDSHTGYHLEHRIFYADGKVGYVAVRVLFVRDAAGKVVKSYGVNQDITERKLLEREHLANLKYFECMEKVNHAIQGGANALDQIMSNVLDVCLSVFDCDRAFLLYPCDPDAPFWHVPMERTRPEYPGYYVRGELIPMDPGMAEILRISLDTTGPVTFAPGSAYPPMEAFWEQHGFRTQMVMALHPKVGKPWQFGLHQCAYARIWTPEEKDLFEKIGRRLSDSLTSLLMYRDLRNSEAFLDSIVDNIPHTIFVKDAETLKFVRINKASEKLLGFSREELIDKSAYDLLPKEQADFYTRLDREALNARELVDIPEETIKNKSNEPRVIHTKKIPLLDENRKPRHLLTISEDITEFKKLQARLNYAQKMEALGAMSGGIAHDFNNILQSILGFCELLRYDLPEGSPLLEYVEGIHKFGMRAKDLVNQILAFSRQADRSVMPVSLQLILKEAAKLSRSIIPSNIELHLDIQKDRAPVMADPTQMHQIIMNLMINACHAMEETGGVISVCLKETQLSEYDLKGTSLPPGGYARLSVSDTGCGMTPNVLDRIFEPYFTTKAHGKGTGLGLAVVYGIVKEHGGHISVYSEVKKGTTFNIYLPLSEMTSGNLPGEKMEIHMSTGSEHILLVDDEEMILRLGSEMLIRLGYRVTTGRHGMAALEIFKKNPDAFDLVISDISMPNMTGDELARELFAIRPDIPIIICTGFSNKLDDDKAKAIGVKEFLMKPISMSEMSEKVWKVLRGKGRP